MRGSVCRESRVSLYRRVCVFGGGNVFVQKNLFFEERYIPVLWAHPTNPVEGCADANPKTELPNDT